MPPKSYTALWILVILLAGVLRFVNLDYKVLHHDEGVNHFFLQNLIRQGSYKYDPTNYHGPTLYFLSQPLAKWADRNGLMRPAAMRVITASFGLAVIALCYGLRGRLGEEAALAGAALLAVSPGMVFISRYYIHEMILVCASLALLVCIFMFWDDPPPDGLNPAPSGGCLLALAAFGISGLLLLSGFLAAKWLLVPVVLGLVVMTVRVGLQGDKQGVLVLVAAALAVTSALLSAYVSKKLFLALLASSTLLLVSLWLYDGPRAFAVVGMGISAGLMFATKETAFITVGVFMIAATMAWFAPSFWALWFPSTPAPRGKKRAPQASAPPSGPVTEAREAVEQRGGLSRLTVLFIAFLAVCVLVNITYYTSFYSHPQGVTDAFEAFKVWKKTGERDHVHIWYRYFEWLAKEEGFVLVVGLAGATFLLTRSRPRAPIMVGLWAIGLVSAYSLIGYKTPWLLPNFILPLALTAGWALMQLPRHVGVGLLALGLAYESYQCYQLNVIHYDNPEYVYVYGHTTRHLHDLIKSIDEVAATRAGKDTKIYVASPDFWPVPYYLRDYKAVGYFNTMTDAIDQDMVIVNHNQVEEFKYKRNGQYRLRQGPINLRPGVDLYLFEKLPLPPGQPEVMPSPANVTMSVPYVPPAPVNTSANTTPVNTTAPPAFSTAMPANGTTPANTTPANVATPANTTATPK